jgi:hypothetical protein
MSVRCVPDGDERDKDVANAIRYAVDNGAVILNMSFGKKYSPGKKAVDDAVKYAEKRKIWPWQLVSIPVCHRTVGRVCALRSLQ